MSRPILLFLIILNIVSLLTAIACFTAIPTAPAELRSHEFEQRVAERLAAVTTPDQMRSSSAELASWVASGTSLVHSSADLIHRILEALITVSVLNLAAVGFLVWKPNRTDK